jgi:hypothetical protein
MARRKVEIRRAGITSHRPVTGEMALERRLLSPHWHSDIPQPKRSNSKGRKPQKRKRVTTISLPVSIGGKRRRLIGRGDYATVPTNPRRAAQGLFSGIGRVIGAGAGHLLGSASTGANLGSAAGDWLGRLVGFGDYSVRKNSIKDRVDMGASTASFSLSGDGVEITHREFLGNVQSSSDFSIQSYPVNPGLAASYPWLSQLACYFDQYEIMGQMYQFHTTSGYVTSTTPALGAVIMATNYDVYDPPFVSKQAMESYEFCTSSIPCQSFVHPLECDPQTKPMNKQYVRNSPVPAGSLLNYDMGTFYIATEGMGATVYTIGELWVVYHVRLSKPKINSFCPPKLLAIQFTLPVSQQLALFCSASTAVSAYDSSGQATLTSSAAPWPAAVIPPTLYINGLSSGPYRGQLYYIDNASITRLIITQSGYYRLMWKFVKTAGTSSGADQTVSFAGGANVTIQFQSSTPGLVAGGGSVQSWDVMVDINVTAGGTTTANGLVMSQAGALTTAGGTVSWSVENLGTTGQLAGFMI